ncbi:MAG TPA: ATP-binding protein [Candidatus Dormibacteraeota bacterium]|nr:ATP-binding protein [Candidatus Dormibacteraeota bacterium]
MSLRLFGTLGGAARVAGKARSGIPRWADLPLTWKGAVVVAIPLLVLTINWGSLLYLTGTEQSDRQAANQAARVTQSGQQVLAELLDAETGVRGYLLSGDPSFLQPYQSALQRLPGLLRALPAQATGSPAAVSKDVARLTALAHNELSTLGLLRASRSAPASALNSYLLAGKTTMDAARVEIEAITAVEATRVAAQDRALAAAGAGILVVLIATVPLGIAGGALAMWLFTRGIGRRIAAVQRSARNLASGAALVPAPADADEVGQLARAVAEAGRLLATREAEVNAAALTAQDANRAKTEFLSRMSHELRTPLNAILGFGQLLELEPRSEEDGESIEQILKAGRHLLELINEVLDLSRIESGHLALSMEPVDTRDVITESVHLLSPMADHAHCALRLELAESPLMVMADRQRLKQVLLNLLSNSIKYNRPGGSVVARSGVGAAGRVVIDVSDTGIGITPEMIPRLFSPFDRLGLEGTSVGGTGLGLALSRSLTEAMDGEIRVASTTGVGTSFTVELGGVPAGSSAGGLTSPAVSGGTDRRPEAQGTLVYIEDNLSNLTLVERLLRQRPQVRLVPAMQGRLGLDLAAEHAPQLVLLDRHLPDIDGAEVLRRLRTHPATAKSAIYILTADASPGQKERLLAAGATGYLTKPIDIEVFLSVLDSAMGDGAALPAQLA